MASNINTTNIDTAFPVAGQDNDSQGFRDNFFNTNQNFVEAKTEIEALQGASGGNYIFDIDQVPDNSMDNWVLTYDHTGTGGDATEVRLKALPVASETDAGILQLADQPEVDAGASTNTAVTPATLQIKIDAEIAAIPSGGQTPWTSDIDSDGFSLITENNLAGNAKDIFVQPGSSAVYGNAGGDINLTGGSGTDYGDGGAVTLRGGLASALIDGDNYQYGGAVQLYGGTASYASEIGGQLFVYGGGDGSSGGVRIQSPVPTNAGYGSGWVQLRTGSVAGSGSAGRIELLMGDNSSTGPGGSFSVECGQSALGAPGTVTLTSGVAGSSSTVNAGTVLIEAGRSNSTNATSGGGEIEILAGSTGSNTASGGSITLTPGKNGDNSVNGVVNIHSAESFAGEAGIVLWNDTNSGHSTGFSVALKAGATLAADITLVLPEAVGAAGAVLTDVAGDGVMSWQAGGLANPLTADLETAGFAIIGEDTVTGTPGLFDIRGGNSTDSSNGGAVSISGGLAGGTGTGGELSLWGGGAYGGGSPRQVKITGGGTDTAGKDGAGVFIGGGYSLTGGGGGIELHAKEGANTNDGRGGDIDIKGGQSYGTGNFDGLGGEIDLTGGEGSVIGGHISLLAGWTNADVGGELNLTSGSAYGGAGVGGNVTLTPGTGTITNGKVVVDGTIETKGITNTAVQTGYGPLIIMDLTLGTYFYPQFTYVNNVTMQFDNPAPAGKVSAFTMEVLTTAGYTATWPASVTWAGGTEPAWTDDGIDIVSFITRDGGTSWHGMLGGLNQS